MKFKVWAITLAYNDPEIIEESIARYYETKHPEVETHHVLVDAHWPVNYPETRRRLEALAASYGLHLMDPGENLGLHGNFNWAWSRLDIPENAGVIGYDGDSWPLNQGWDMAMCQVFVNDAKVGWISLWHQHVTRELYQDKKLLSEDVIGGQNTATPKEACMNSICMFRQGWLKKIGGLKEFNKYYGSLEICLYPKLAEHGLKQVFMKDFKEEPHFYDRQNPLYKEWKWRTCHVRDIPTDMEFGTWLRSRK